MLGSFSFASFGRSHLGDARSSCFGLNECLPQYFICRFVGRSKVKQLIELSDGVFGRLEAAVAQSNVCAWGLPDPSYYDRLGNSDFDYSDRNIHGERVPWVPRFPDVDIDAALARVNTLHRLGTFNSLRMIAKNDTKMDRLTYIHRNVRGHEIGFVERLCDSLAGNTHLATIDSHLGEAGGTAVAAAISNSSVVHVVSNYASSISFNSCNCKPIGASSEDFLMRACFANGIRRLRANDPTLTHLCWRCVHSWCRATVSFIPTPPVSFSNYAAYTNKHQIANLPKH